jgi:hypothetical protein
MSLCWKKTVLDTRFRSEGVAVADVNGDGRLDILTGNEWYEAPHWKPHRIRETPDFEPETSYSNSFINFAHDVDGDGWPDLIVIGFPGKEALWLQNPRGEDRFWTPHLIHPSACNESPLFEDIDGDGVRELIMSLEERQMAWLKPGSDPFAPWEVHPIGEEGAPGTAKYAHGLGAGDINGDGHLEVLTRQGYFAHSGDPRGRWQFTPADFGPDCVQMHVADFNGDGLPDVITSSAHLKGIWWHEQRRDEDGPWFGSHLIDQTWSQSHALLPADLDGDGITEWVTGKRLWAHGPAGDVDANKPCVLYYYKPAPMGRRVEWERHLIDEDSGVGTQFEIADVNGDGLLDIVTANKKGVFLFEQLP